MNKKITAIALSALLLTACHAEEKEGQVTGTATELTLTEITTEEVFPEPEDNGIIELAVYNPFTDLIDVDDSVRTELTEAMKKILDGWAFYNTAPERFYKGSRYENNYADTDIVMGVEQRNGQVYFPLNPEIAETEEELVEYFKSVISETYLGAPHEQSLYEYRGVLNDDLPAYKTIDGTLCMLTYLPIEDVKKTDIEKLIIFEYDGTTAEMATESPSYTGASANVRHFSKWTISKCEEYGWRLDNVGWFEYDELRMNMLHTLLLNSDKINDVLSGKPDKSKSVIINNEEYYLSQIDMDIEKMRRFFKNIFYEEALTMANDRENGVIGDPLCEDYIRKYIDEVYAEKEGELYRKASAPEWYLPEIKIRPDVSIIKRDNLSAFTVPIVIDGESHPITVKYGIEVGGVKPLCFASGLPIKEITE